MSTQIKQLSAVFASESGSDNNNRLRACNNGNYTRRELGQVACDACRSVG